MATANELFAANGEDYIVIDSDLRTMTFPASVNNIGVENDKDVHKLNFKMPRYFSGYDLSEFTIHINYVNANGDADMYYVLDPTIKENEIIFSWLVGRHACLYRGSVTFIVCLKLADGEGDVAQEYNTTLASLQVLPGLETEPTILETEHDIIEQLLLSINDTNAKIKAVLDTGLTPEQIAEFYNKSKNYDTEITTLNNNTYMLQPSGSNSLANGTDILSLANGVYYAGSNEVASTLVNKPSDLGLNCKIIVEERVPLRKCITVFTGVSRWINQQVSASEWSGWTKQPTRAEVDTLNSRLSNGGINSEIEYYSNTDANTHLTAGIRYYGTGCSNVPVNYIYIITLSSKKSGDTVQIGFPVGEDTIYVRRGRRTTADFSAWKKIDFVAIS